MEQPGFWRTVREALRGTSVDLTAVSIRRAVVLLALPTVLEMSMEALFTIVDIFLASRLGPDAVSTVGLTESMMAIVYSLAMGLSAGAVAIIARRVGEKDPEAASRAAVDVIVLSLLTSLVLGVAGASLAPHLLEAMGAEPEVVAGGAPYTRVMLATNAVVFLLFVANAVFRSAGDAAVAMRALWIANIVNIALAPCLMFGWGPFPRLGIVGAAWATTVGRGIGVAYQLRALTSGRARIELLRRHLSTRLQTARELVRIATPATMQVLIETASWMGIVRLMSSYGNLAFAGYTIAMRIVIFALMPSWGLSSAAATLVGQNLGARQPERARRSVLAIALYNVVFLAPVGLMFTLLPHFFVTLFTRDPEAVAYGSDCLRMVGVGFVAFAFGMVAIQAFNGAGDTRTPMLVNLGSFWLCKIPLAYALAWGAGWGPRGAFFAITVAYAVQATSAGLLFWRGGWQRVELGAPKA